MNDDEGPKPGELAPTGFRPRLMTQDEQLRAIEWINSRASAGPTDPCQVCGQTSEIQPSLVALDGGVAHDRTVNWVFPSVVTVCKTCGFTRYFNAMVMGIVTGDLM